MNLPMKKTSEEDSEEEGLTTADLAQGRRPAATEELARPVLAGRPASDQGYAAETMSLFPRNELEEMRVRWNGIQAAFVDEPRHAVEQADGLVATGMKRLAEVFAEERSRLEAQWDRGNNVSTEELRLALQRYRSFFHRLLNV